MSVSLAELPGIVQETVNRTPITDIHTHLYAPHFGSSFLLSGIDELITYHYLVAEMFRASSISYEEFWKMSKKEQADHIWQTLFMENTPYSESCRGVVTVLNKLGLGLSSKDLPLYREQLGVTGSSDYIDRIFERAGVRDVVMTNDPFDSNEREVWLSGAPEDHRFHTALRIDPMLNHYDRVYTELQAWGYQVEHKLNEQTIQELQRFVREWVDRLKALYVAVSLPGDFRFPDQSHRSRIIEEVILPVCREQNIPFAMMIGVKRQVNPQLQTAGDGVGKANIQVVEHLCSHFSQNKFMVTMLSRENQHELTVAARKFRNLMVFGCWWFLNNPSLIEEMTRMRFELLGSTVIPQHSDARVLEQLIYKWDHSRHIITQVLTEKYTTLLESGWPLERSDVERDVEKLFGQNFWNFLKLQLA